MRRARSQHCVTCTSTESVSKNASFQVNLPASLCLNVRVLACSACAEGCFRNHVLTIVIITSGQTNLTLGCIAAANGWFNRIRQVAPMCHHRRVHWRNLANTIELVPIRVHNPNGILIGSTVFAGLTSVTDRPRSSVGNSRSHLRTYSTAMRRNNNTNQVCTAPECQKTSVALTDERRR